MNEITERLNAYYHAFLKALPRISVAILILVVGIIVLNWLTRIIKRKIAASSHDPLMSGFLANAIKLALFVVLFLLALHIAG